MPDFPSLADALKGHREDYDSVFPSCECGWTQGDDSEVGPFWRDHADALWREVRTIRTVEELAALPEGSVVRYHDGSTDQRDVEGEWSWSWGAMEALLTDGAALLIWHPDWVADA